MHSNEGENAVRSDCAGPVGARSSAIIAEEANARAVSAHPSASVTAKGTAERSALDAQSAVSPSLQVPANGGEAHDPSVSA